VSKRVRIALLLAVCPALLAASPVSAAPGDVLFGADFDASGSLGDRWSAAKLTAARKPLDEPADVAGVAGAVVTVETPAGGMLYTKPLDPRPPLARGDRVRLYLAAEGASEADPFELEIRFMVGNGRIRWWRKVALTDPGWQAVEAPLRFFRASRGSLPAWEKVNRFALYFREAGALRVDGIAVLEGTNPTAAYLGADELVEVAFPGADDVRTLRRGPFVLLTTAAGLNTEATLASLEAMYEQVRTDFPVWPEPTRPVPLVVFPTHDAYRAFWPRFGRRLGSEAPAPTAGGYTTLGVATSYYKPFKGGFRPVYPHEACHALLEQVLGLASHGEWLHEAIANRCQIRVAKQDIRPIIREGLQNASYRDRLVDLLNGERIATTRYWQAVTVLEWFLHEEALKARFLAAVEKMRTQASTDVRPLATKPVFGMTMDEMEAAWLRWARDHYAVETETQAAR